MTHHTTPPSPEEGEQGRILEIRARLVLEKGAPVERAVYLRVSYDGSYHLEDANPDVFYLMDTLRTAQEQLQAMLKAVAYQVQLTDVCPLCEGWRASEGVHAEDCPMREHDITEYLRAYQEAD